MTKGIIIGFSYAAIQLGLMVMSICGLIWLGKGVDNNHIGLGIVLFIALMILAIVITAIMWEAYR